MREEYFLTLTNAVRALEQTAGDTRFPSIFVRQLVGRQETFIACLDMIAFLRLLLGYLASVPDEV